MCAKEQDFLICRPVAVPGYVVHGSLTTNCSHCGCSVFVAPSGQMLLRAHPGMNVICWVCGGDMIREHPGTIQPIMPAQLEEIQEAQKQLGN